MKSKVKHWQLVTKNPAAAATFYTALFGWKISEANNLGYRMVSGAGISGGIWPAPPDAPEITQLYVEVDNIDDALANVERLGGRIIMAKQILPDGDAMALAADPMGRPFGIMQTLGG